MRTPDTQSRCVARETRRHPVLATVARGRRLKSPRVEHVGRTRPPSLSYREVSSSRKRLRTFLLCGVAMCGDCVEKEYPNRVSKGSQRTYPVAGPEAARTSGRPFQTGQAQGRRGRVMDCSDPVAVLRPRSPRRSVAVSARRSHPWWLTSAVIPVLLSAWGPLRKPQHRHHPGSGPPPRACPQVRFDVVQISYRILALEGTSEIIHSNPVLQMMHLMPREEK